MIVMLDGWVGEFMLLVLRFRMPGNPTLESPLLNHPLSGPPQANYRNLAIPVKRRGL